MKKILLSILIILSLAMPVWSEPTTVRTNQVRGDVYTKAETDTAIAAATSSVSVNQTVDVLAGETLTSGQIVSLINESGTMKAYHNALTVNSQPNGSESTFNAAATTYCSAVSLSDTRFLVAYKKADTYGYAKVGTVSGSSISWGAESATFKAATAVNSISVCKIATDKVLVCYSQIATGGVEAVVMTISTSTITVGTSVAHPTETSQAVGISVTQLDTDKALCVLNSGTDTKGRANVVTVSTTTPTWNADAIFNAAASAYCSVSALSATSAIVAYQDGGNSSYGTAQVLSISGTTITPNAETVFYAGTTARIGVSTLSATSGFVTYNHNATTGWAQVLSVSGTSVTANTEYQVGDSPCYAVQNKAIDATHALVAYEVNDVNGSSKIATISGTAISFGTAYVFNAGNSLDDLTIAMLSGSKAVIGYADYTNSQYGSAVVSSFYSPIYDSIRGLCQTTTTSGSSAPILISGSFNGLSGLLTGSDYFVNSSFELQTTAVLLNGSYIKMGIAKSSTEIILD